MGKRWITFDLDGTLMQNPFGKWVFPEIEGLIREALKQDDLHVTSALVEEHERRMKENRWVEAYDWDDIVQQFINRYSLKLSIDVEALAMKHSVSPKVYLLEENIPETLKRLKDSGYSLAVLTNGFYKYQIPVMNEIGLTPLFDKIITPEMVGVAKPNPTMFLPLESEGNLVGHVGDRIDHDVAIAASKGIPSVWICRNLPEELQDLPLHERIMQERAKTIVMDKWQKETKGEPFPQVFPSSIIFSIQELPKLFS